MELRHLRNVQAEAEELHLARAGEKLHIEQSPLLRAIEADALSHDTMSTPTIQAFLGAALLALAGAHAWATDLPPAIAQQLPAGYEAVAVQQNDFNADRAVDFVVVAADSKAEHQAKQAQRAAPKRWLYVFLRAPDGSYRIAGKNPAVAFAADLGGQCDPFLDSGGLAVKGPYFTVENSVACGSHWSDFITFKYDPPTRRFVFHRRVIEVWELNPSTRPDAEALIRTQKIVTSGKRSAPVTLDAYEPK